MECKLPSRVVLLEEEVSNFMKSDNPCEEMINELERALLENYSQFYQKHPWDTSMLHEQHNRVYSIKEKLDQCLRDTDHNRSLFYEYERLKRRYIAALRCYNHEMSQKHQIKQSQLAVLASELCITAEQRSDKKYLEVIKQQYNNCKAAISLLMDNREKALSCITDAIEGKITGDNIWQK